MTTPTILLVHGAWHGAWCFEPLQHQLGLLGIDAIAVDLASTGDDVESLGGLSDDVAVVRDTIASIDGDVVLVGHSYGGMVISEAALGCETVRQLVYLAAFFPFEGDSMLSITSGGRAPWLEFGDGAHRVAAGAGRRLFYTRTPDEIAVDAESRLRWQSLASFADPVAEVAWRDLPTTYIVCTDDSSLPTAMQRGWAPNANDTIEIDSDHSPFLSQPANLASVIASKVREPVR